MEHKEALEISLMEMQWSRESHARGSRLAAGYIATAAQGILPWSRIVPSMDGFAPMQLHLFIFQVGSELFPHTGVTTEG